MATLELTPLQAPINAVMPALPQNILIATFGSVIAATLVWAVILLLRHKDQRLLVMLACGAAASLVEGMACYLIQCHHASIGIVSIYTAFGIYVPLWLAEIYVLFFGLGGYVFLKQFSASPTAKTFCLSFIIIGLGEGIAEMSLLPQGMWRYWGVQPLPMFGFPAYLGFINASMALVFATSAMAWFRLVRGPACWLLVAITPPLIGGLYAGLAMPVASGLYAGNAGLAFAGGLLTMAFSVAVSFGMYHLLRWMLANP